MRISSFLLSILLHLALLAFVLYVPLRPPVDLSRPVYQISLVMGAPGGENLPSPVLGPRPPVTGTQVNSTEPPASPKADEAPAPAPEAVSVPKLEEPPKAEPPKPEPPKEPEPVKVPEVAAVPPAPQPEPEKKPAPEPEKKPEPAKKPEPEKKPEPKEPPKPEPKKEQPKPSAKADPLAAALADVRKQANANTGKKSGGSSSASRALADLEKQVGKTGVGGGGGEGTGPGGGGIYDVYVAQVVLAVQPNWSILPAYSRSNIVVQVRIKLDKQGRVLDCQVERSSGRPEFDASAVNAVVRTGTLPPPPTAAQQDLLINFNSLQMAGR